LPFYGGMSTWKSDDHCQRTRYDYSDLQAHLDAKLLRLVTKVRVYDALADNDNNNDVLKAEADYSYDDYPVKGGMEFYGLTSGSYPPNHDSAFDQNNTIRGNITGVQTFSAFGPDVSTTRYSKYDIFGNVVQADVSCCQVKTFGFNSTNYYSQPVAVTSGTPGVVPFLTTNFQYDFNTGLVTRVTDPSNLITQYGYDSAWRVQMVTAASGAVTTTQPDRDANGNDQLAYIEHYHQDRLSTAIDHRQQWSGDGYRRPSSIRRRSGHNWRDREASLH
jgi:YD repeat-containing protein